MTNPPPTITAVENDATNDFGTPGTIAQGGLFVVKGSAMSATGYNPLAPPYPQSAGGTSITFTPTSGGRIRHPALSFLHLQRKRR
ncbi:MAG: hypothetical protein WDO73_02410 [Ignavibacteriota bacterium]